MFQFELPGSDPLAMPSPETPAGIPITSDSPNEVFTLKWCHVLADSLHERTGWPVVVVGDGPSGRVGWVHAGVRMPDGRILDVEGAHHPWEWLDEWGEIVDALAEDLDGFYDDEAVQIYETYSANSEGDFLVDVPPGDVQAMAARTADSILAQLSSTVPPALSGADSLEAV